MLDFSTFQIILIVIGAVALIIHLIYDNAIWIEFYGGAQSNLYQVHEIYSYLRKNGVKCRIINRSQPISTMQISQIATVTIEIKKGEEDKANRLLSEFHKKR